VSDKVRRVVLEETVNLASLDVNVDVEITRGGGKTGDGLNVCSEGVAGNKAH